MLAWQGDRIAGLARAAADPDFEEAEAAVVIRADLRDKGLARQLLQALFGAMTVQGVRRAVMVYPANLARINAIGTELGFTIAPSPNDAAVARATKVLV
jgi:acetyltransferase